MHSEYDFFWNQSDIRNRILKRNVLGTIKIVAACEQTIGGEEGGLSVELVFIF